MSHPVDRYVGNCIRQRRWVIGMTQQQLAQAVGIKFQQIQKYETGQNRVSASRLWDIATALEVPISFFFEGAKDCESQSKTNDLLKRKETVELLRTYYAVPESTRKKILDLVRALGGISK